MSVHSEHPRDELRAYATGALPSERRQAIATHLAGCLPCRQRLATFDAVDHLIWDIPLPRDHAARRTALTARLHARTRRRLRPHPRWWRVLLVAGPPKVVLLTLAFRSKHRLRVRFAAGAAAIALAVVAVPRMVTLTSDGNDHHTDDQQAQVRRHVGVSTMS